jgi:hypothetical protein
MAKRLRAKLREIKEQLQRRRHESVVAQPRTDPYVRNYLIRLLPRMSDGEAHAGIRVKNAGTGQPPIQSGIEALPRHPGTLAPPLQSAVPSPCRLSPERYQTAVVHRDRMVVEVTLHHRPQPGSCPGISAPTPSRHTATCSLSFCDSAAMCGGSLRRDCGSNRLMFRKWKHSWITWSGKESLHPAHEITGLRPCTPCSDMFRLENRRGCFSVKKSSPSPSGGTLAPPSHTLRKKSWLRSWCSPTSEPQGVEEIPFC